MGGLGGPVGALGGPVGARAPTVSMGATPMIKACSRLAPIELSSSCETLHDLAENTPRMDGRVTTQTI